MDAAIREQLNLPPVNQVGFVVKDLKKAIELYAPLFGEFIEMDTGEMEWEYRGKPENSHLKIAFANSDDVEIELIEWVSGGTPHKEFLDAGREGMHHLRFMVDNLEEKVAEVETTGYKQIWYKRFAEGLAASYLEREGDPLILELYENNLG